MPPKNRKSAPRRRPHNVPRERYESFDELLVKIAHEPRKAILGEEEVTMSRLEFLLRTVVDRAMAGQVREMTLILKVLADHPGLAATARTQIITVVGSALAGA